MYKKLEVHMENKYKNNLPDDRHRYYEALPTF